MPEIKTRQVQKGTIKSLDRAAALACRMKDVQTRTKDLVDDPRTRSSRSSDEYASNRITGMAKDTGADAVYAAEKTATWSTGKIRHAVSQAQKSGYAIPVRARSFVRIRRKKLAEKELIAARQRSIRNFANSRQLDEDKRKRESDP